MIAGIDVSISALPVYQDGEIHWKDGSLPRCRHSYKDSRVSCEVLSSTSSHCEAPSAGDGLPVVRVGLGDVERDALWTGLSHRGGCSAVKKLTTRQGILASFVMFTDV